MCGVCSYLLWYTFFSVLYYRRGGYLTVSGRSSVLWEEGGLHGRAGTVGTNTWQVRTKTKGNDRDWICHTLEPEGEGVYMALVI